MMNYRTMLMTMTIAVAATVAACGGGSNYSPTQPTPAPQPPATPAPPTPPPSGNSQRVTIGGGSQSLGAQAFGMNPLTVTVGTTVTWVNDDTIPHTATADTGSLFNTGTINAGASASFTFNAAGTVPYHCAIHPGMVGTIVVQ